MLQKVAEKKVFIFPEYKLAAVAYFMHVIKLDSSLAQPLTEGWCITGQSVASYISNIV